MTPQEFLETIVRPMFEEANRERLNMGKSLAAVALTDMLAAHIYRAKSISGEVIPWSTGEVNDRKDDTGYRYVLARQNEDFALLHEVATANKHVTRIGNIRKVTTTDQMKTDTMGYGLGKYGEGPYGGTEQIIVETNDGSARNLLSLIKASLTFLEGQIT